MSQEITSLTFSLCSSCFHFSFSFSLSSSLRPVKLKTQMGKYYVQLFNLFHFVSSLFFPFCVYCFQLKLCNRKYSSLFFRFSFSFTLLQSNIHGYMFIFFLWLYFSVFYFTNIPFPSILRCSNETEKYYGQFLSIFSLFLPSLFLFHINFILPNAENEITEE